jgi:gliding motility-associated-like protein
MLGFIFMTNLINKKPYLYLITLLINISLFAQTPCFTTNDTIGCLPHTVTLTNCSGSDAVVYIYDENGTKDTTTSNTYTYTTGGNHSITQLINTPTGLQSLIKPDYIKTIDRPLPIFTLHACEGLEVLTKIDNDDYQKYIISYSDGTINDTVPAYSITTKIFLDTQEKTITVTGYYENFDCTNTTSKTVLPIISLEEPQLQKLILTSSENTKEAVLSFNANTLLEYYTEQKTTTSNYQIIDSIQPSTEVVKISFNDVKTSPYTYRISSFDRCGNSIQSKEISTIELSVSPENNQNNLFWTNYASSNDLSNYQITKDSIIYTSVTINNFTDSAVRCGKNYCYHTTANLSYLNTTTGLQVVSISQTECVSAISTDTPPPITNFQSTFTSNNLSVHWEAPSDAPHEIYHLIENKNQQGYSLIDNFATDDTLKAIPTTIDDITNLCYLINYTDICGNNAPESSETCPIILSIITNDYPQPYEANWTAYHGFEPETYWLNMYDIDNKLIDQIETGKVLSYTFNWPNNENQIVTFSISTTNISSETHSTSITLEEETLILIPNAFTPNDDDLNDTFKPVGRFIDTYSISVFNSMGLLTFVSSGEQKAWDGKENGKHVPEGTYYYEMTVTDKKGTQSTKNGSVTLIY